MKRRKARRFFSMAPALPLTLSPYLQIIQHNVTTRRLVPAPINPLLP